MTEEELQKLLKEKKKTRFAIWSMQEVGKLSLDQWERTQRALRHRKIRENSNG
jgi:hypothetical protein